MWQYNNARRLRVCIRLWSDFYLRVWGIATFRPRVFRVFQTAAKGPFFVGSARALRMHLFVFLQSLGYTCINIIKYLITIFSRVRVLVKKKKRGLLVTEPVWYLFRVLCTIVFRTFVLYCIRVADWSLAARCAMRAGGGTDGPFLLSFFLWHLK